MTNEITDTRELLHQTALSAPSSSGVYLWRNIDKKVIYVGKAKNLKNRLSSYFSGQKDIKTQMLITHAASIEYITTTNEYEAFLLENNLIKKYSPRYNINLKDGKSYPSLKITNEDFPRIVKTRHVTKDGAKYFGPFPDATALDIFIKTLYKLYPLRHCKKMKKGNPCMYYHIGQCKAPCCEKIDKSTYNQFIDEIRRLLEDKGFKTEKKMEREMKLAAKNLDFEKAARLRDGLKALTVLQNQNVVESFDTQDRDYIAVAREGEQICFVVLKVRLGKLLDRDKFRSTSLEEDDEVQNQFICAYYKDKDSIPPNIFVQTDTDLENLSKWLNENYSVNPKITAINTEAEAKQLERHTASMNMAIANAKEELRKVKKEKGDIPAMEELKKVLNLSVLPRRIEGFDIAHIGGKFPVASLISFYNGNPDKKNYREFRLKTTDGIIDDFASMKEAATRRYSRLSNEKFELPDLILIDGGIGQVNAVDAIIKSLGLNIPIAGLAKRDEEIYRPGNSTPVCLPKRSDGLRLLQRVRDETHRFATSRNQELRTKENIVSAFTELPHVAKERSKILIKNFMTMENLANSEESQIAQLLHVRADEASDILLSARAIVAKRKRSRKKLNLESSVNDIDNEIKTASYDSSSQAENLALLAAEDEESYSK
ncbi:MAG: excinuclease ABC subunit UvrC [Treponema sp.]|nr:excinuclease ABC subunit UvrC [Treponema sp.]